MHFLHKIYQGNQANKGSETFSFVVKDYKHVCGVFCSGGTALSLVLDNKKKILLREFEQRNTSDVPPNKRPLLFDKTIDMDFINGVISNTDGTPIDREVSVYLILKK